MRILLITPLDAGGHHNEYKELLAQGFTDLGHEVIHFPQTLEKLHNNNSSNAFLSGKGHNPSNFFKKYFTFIITIRNIRQRAILNWQSLFNHLHNLESDLRKPDLIFFECIDASIGQYITKRYINKNLNLPFSGILISPHDTRSMSKSLLRRGLLDPYNVLKSKWCSSIFVLMAESIQGISNLIHKPVFQLPDIVSVSGSIQDNSLGSMIRERAGKRFIIGIWGSLEQRKGTAEFLQMSSKLAADKYFFIMGGRFDMNNLPELAKKTFSENLSGKLENLLIIDRWLTDDELLSGIASCNLVFAAYPGWKFSSGIIGKTAAVNVPILVNDGYIMAKRVRDYEIGFVKQENQDAATWVSENIDSIKNFSNSSDFKLGCLRYCNENSYEQWQSSLTNLLSTIK